MSYFVVDVESDGPLLGVNSMICFGAVKVDEELKTTFYGQVEPISDIYDEETLSISGFSRIQHESFNNVTVVFKEFYKWILENSIGQPILISDNNQYDGSWINYYFLRFVGSNPFGYSSRRLGDLFCSIKGNVLTKWKHLRITEHTHYQVDDAKRNAEIILYMRDKLGLKIKLE